MTLETLLQHISDPQAETRLTAIQILGMAQETLALEPLQDRFKAEYDPHVLAALNWVGPRVHKAKQQGYSTIEEMCRYFGIDREISNLPDPKEAEMLRRMQSSFDAEMVRMQQQAGKRRVTIAAMAGAGGMVAGGSSIGVAAMSSALAEPSAPSNLGSAPRESISTKRTPAQRPSTMNIQVWVKKLAEDPNPNNRKRAAIELANFNNPEALPHIGAAFAAETVHEVRDAIEEFGKILYWKAIYWQMEQDGSFQQFYRGRALAMGKIPPA